MTVLLSRINFPFFYNHGNRFRNNRFILRLNLHCGDHCKKKNTFHLELLFSIPVTGWQMDYPIMINADVAFFKIPYRKHWVCSWTVGILSTNGNQLLCTWTMILCPFLVIMRYIIKSRYNPGYFARFKWFGLFIAWFLDGTPHYFDSSFGICHLETFRSILGFTLLSGSVDRSNEIPHLYRWCPKIGSDISSGVMSSVGVVVSYTNTSDRVQRSWSSVM